MRELVVVTQNLHKLEEIRHILDIHFIGLFENSIRILSLRDIQCYDDIPETQMTLEGNALQKAHYINQVYGFDCFADDTGLEIEALDGRPGVFSARYAGEDKSFDKNITRVLQELQGIQNRRARFRCVIALILEKQEFLFEGTVNGIIIDKRRGKGGFGYDSIFIPEGFDQTFAEMPAALKNTISHRFNAIQKLFNFLLNPTP